VQVWSLEAADAAAPPLGVTGCSVTALAADEATGLAWVGTEEGEIMLVR